MFSILPFKSASNRLARHEFFNDLNNMFSDLIGSNSLQNIILVKTWETEDGVNIEADMPGVTKENLEVSLLEDNVLRIAATRQESKANGTEICKELRYGRSERILNLPCGVVEDGCTATLKDGVLSLSFKKSSGNKTRRITVKQT